MSGGQTLWDGVVHVFDLKGSDSGAFRAYAWPCRLDTGKQEFFTILHSPRVFSPVLAVRAAIVKNGREAAKNSLPFNGRGEENHRL